MNPTLRDLYNANACGPGYNFYRKHNCDPSALVPDHPGWYLWLVEYCPGEWIDSELLDKCAEALPREAIYAASLLSPERLDRCAEREPYGALRNAAALLSPERLDRFAEEEPRVTLIYAAAHLSPERLDWCAEKAPWHALAYAASLLSPSRRARCEEQLKGL